MTSFAQLFTNRNTAFHLLGALLSLALLPAFAGAGHLLSDGNYAESRQRALVTQQPLYLVFTGSDGCTWCRKLETELLEDPRLKDRLESAFVMVRFDTLRHRNPPLKQKRRYRAMAHHFEVDTVPAVLVVNPRDETILLRHAYLDVSVARYMEILEQFQPLPPAADKQEPKFLKKLQETGSQ